MSRKNLFRYLTDLHILRKKVPKSHIKPVIPAEAIA